MNQYLVSYQYNAGMVSGFGCRIFKYKKFGFNEILDVLDIVADELETESKNVVILAISKLEN